MTDPIAQSDQTYGLARRLLDVSALRQEALASNLANVETPAYRRLDVAPDFAAQLKAQMAAGVPTSAMDDVQPKLAEDPHARTVRPDGNTVDVERELLAMNQNSVEYGYLTQIVSGSIKQLKMAISGNVT